MKLLVFMSLHGFLILSLCTVGLHGGSSFIVHFSILFDGIQPLLNLQVVEELGGVVPSKSGTGIAGARPSCV